MYEVNRHVKDLEEVIERIKKGIAEKDLEGLLVIRVTKSEDTQIDAVLGRVTQFEWVGIMDYATDVIKDIFLGNGDTL